MRSRFFLVVWLAAVLLLVPGAAFGQIANSEGLYCTAGLIPDGYIDFSGLPKAPVFPAGSTSAPVTATLPVHGVPGLTVTVTIPALTVAHTSAPSPLYTVNGGTLSLNGLPEPSNPAVLLLNFGEPIDGIGLDMETTGRFVYSYTLQVGAPSQGPVTFATSATGDTLDLGEPQAQSLQIASLDTSFPAAAVLFPGGPGSEYSTITLSNIRVRSTSAPDPSKAVPTNGLQQWLRADTSNALGGTWKDQSGNGHDATPATVAPMFSAGGHNCRPTFAFGGNANFNFNLPIAGWNQMTVFLVARAATDPPPGSYFSENSAILWTEDQSWGNTFVSPYQTQVSARFGTTQVGNNLSYSRPGGGIGQDFTSTRAVHDNGTDSLYVNGQLVFSQGGKLSALGGVTGAGTIGEGFDHTFFNGDISEILVYNRVLSTNEAAAVENYLAQKYGLH